MTRPNPKRVAHAHRLKTAGEVRFIKDRSGDKSEWGWGPPGPSEREIQEDFVFNARYLKPLAITMRSALMALGHATSAHARFVKIKSRNLSPDGSLGGKGYIQKIPDMRRQLMNCVEALSALTDTIHDEINAPHWNPVEDTMDSRDRDEVREIVEEAEEIREDPEAWAHEEEEEEKEEASEGKQASSSRVLRRYARQMEPSFPPGITVSVKDAPELWEALNNLQRVLLSMQLLLRKVGYWDENIIGDLKAGKVTQAEVPLLLQMVDVVIEKLRKPHGDLQRNLRNQLNTKPRYASNKRNLELAVSALERTFPSSREVTASVRDPDVIGLAGDLRSVSQHLRQVLETHHA